MGFPMGNNSYYIGSAGLYCFRAGVGDAGGWYKWSGSLWLNDYGGAQDSDGACPPPPSTNKARLLGGGIGVVVGGIAGYLIGGRRRRR